MSRDHRFGLANARRKWLHYNAMMTGITADAERVARDLKPIVEDFEAACDRIDDLTARLEKLQKEVDALREPVRASYD